MTLNQNNNQLTDLTINGDYKGDFESVDIADPVGLSYKTYTILARSTGLVSVIALVNYLLHLDGVLIG
jgi:hypothetical protein